MVAAFAVSALCANAQVWIGGNVGFNSTSYEGLDDNETIVQLRPEIGYSLNENWDVAVGLGLSRIGNYLGVKDANAFAWEVSPYARYTFAKVKNVGFFVDGGVSVGVYNPDGAPSTTTYWVGIKPGVKFAATDKLTLVAHVGSLGYKNKKDQYSTFGFGVDGGDLSFGLYYAF